MQHNMWYVVTGGPSTGKTTLLNELKKQGFAVVPEAARTLIDRALQSGQTVEALREDEQKFQEDVAQLKFEIEQNLDPTTPTFFDRGMQDTLAYLEQNKLPTKPWIYDYMRRSSYEKVFILESLGTFEEDYARTETSQFTTEIHHKLIDAYSTYGMTPVIVPALSVKQRVNFVLENVKKEMLHEK